MKVSLNTIKQYIDFELPPVDELVARINSQLGGVEEVTDLAAKYKDVVIVKVVDCEKHPNADKLSVCMIDDGGTVADVERDERGFVRVVCGAPNVHADMFAAWLPPRATVPATFNDAEPFVLDARELRGIKSNGMLAAADELALGADHAGIIEIAERDVLSQESRVKSQELKAGLSFAEVFGLDDVIIDIENKMFTHRPDCFGQLGVAREIAGILGQQFTSPQWYSGQSQESRVKSQEGDLALEVFNECADKVPRFMAVAIDDVTVKPSPLWLQIELVRLGGKPINNIVDVTNYVMLLTAQPTHAYDYDKLRTSQESGVKSQGKVLGARMAKRGEKATLLNGKTYELTEDDIVIVDGEGIVGLGGVMGGGNSEVSADTKRIVLEVANFDMYTVRKTSMRHGIFTDAVSRFNKGQSPLQNAVVLNLLVQSVVDAAGGRQATQIFDLPSQESRVKSQEIEISTEFINDRLGLKLDEAEVSTLLNNVEFNFNLQSSIFNLAPPFWRTDIELPEDIVEEVGRLYGFDKLPRELPQRSISPAAKNPSFELKKQIRSSLSRAGANEVLTYSFVHEKTLKNADQNPDDAYKLSNALSPDLQYYRLSVLPSLLDKIHGNVKAGHDEFTLFEIGKGHIKSFHDNEDTDLPGEMRFVDAVYTSKKPGSGAAYYRVRKLVAQLARDLGFTLRFKPIVEPLNSALAAPFEQSRSALVEAADGTVVGLVGELKQSVIKNFKLPAYTAAMTLDFDRLQQVYQQPHRAYTPLSKYPSIMQDISLKVSVDVSYGDVFWTAWQAAETAQPGECDAKLEPLSIYQAKDDSAHKTITLRLTIASYEKTLRDADVAKILDEIASATANKNQAEKV